MPQQRREGNGKLLRVIKAHENNLQDITVDFPLGKMICVTGVSGSGKSTLINEILYKTLAAALNGARSRPGQCEAVEGMEWVDKVIGIDQSPIGRTPRSNPATYTGVFSDIRALFASTQDAKMRGYGPGRFSFNVKEAAAKPVKAAVSCRSRCISCRISMFRVMSVRASGITAKPWKSSTRTKPFPMYWI